MTDYPSVGWRSIRQVVVELRQAIRVSPPDDASTPDVIGELDAAISLLRGLRNDLLAEAPGPIDGEDYRLRPERKADRSYNSSRLLADFAEAMDGPPLEVVLQELIAEDVIRLSWQWSKLQQAADRWDVTLAVAKHEVEEDDLDAPHVGEVWKERLVPSPIRKAKSP